MINKNLLQDVVFCNDDASVLDVSRILRDTRTRHLIVVNEKNNPVGIISTVDINNRVVAEEKNSSTLKARDIMTKPIETVEVSSTCEEAYQKMVSKGTYSIPVTENGSLIGSLSFSKLFGKVC
ncbi:CBS domain-containing protein [Candidatus Pacearchaeota archaeon]|nr:CBS domain-containing protein [Candidatus Pacearchaeota archaeon]